MIELVKKFATLTRENGLLQTTNQTIDFLANRVSRKLASFTPLPESPIDIEGSKMLFIEAVGKVDGWGYGDGILRLPIIEWLGRKGELQVLTRDRRSPIFQENPHISASHSIGEVRSIASVLDLIGRLRNERFDHIITLHPSWKMIFLSFFIKTNNSEVHTSVISLDELRTTNLIELFLGKVKKSLGYESDYYVPSPKIFPGKLPEDISKMFSPAKNYIGVNVGAKSGLRNFREWAKVFGKLQSNKEIPSDTIFVLVGREGVGNIDGEILDILDERNVLNFCNRTTLEQAYQIVSHCNGGFIGMDGGNVNAAIALRHITQSRVIPIYNAVNPELRVPSNLPQSDCAIIPCPEKQNCFSSNIALSCTITKQPYYDNTRTPPCLENPESIDIVYEALKSLIKK